MRLEMDDDDAETIPQTVRLDAHMVLWYGEDAADVSCEIDCMTVIISVGSVVTNKYCFFCQLL